MRLAKFWQWAACTSVALTTATVLAADGGERAERTRQLAGEVSKIDAGTLTLTVHSDAGERSADLKLDSNTRFTIESEETVRTFGERGEVQERHKAIAGKSSDLKVGQRVMVLVNAEGTATEVIAPLASRVAENNERARRAAAEGEAARAREGGDRPPGITLDVDEEGGITIGRRKMQVEQLSQYIGMAVKRDDRLAVTVRPSKGLPYKDVEVILKAMAESGVKNVKLVPPGDREAAGDAPPREGRARDGNVPRDGDRPQAEGARDGDRPKVDAPRDGDRPRGDAPRDGERPKNAGPRDGDRPNVDGPRDGERPKGDAPRDGDAPAAGKEDKKLGRGDVLSGDIAKVSADSISVSTGGTKKTPATLSAAIPVAADAQIILEGKPAKLSDLQPGMPVTLTTQNGKAVRIEVPIDLSKPRK
jgi:biopolymer transport protein ExbD